MRIFFIFCSCIFLSTLNAEDWNPQGVNSSWFTADNWLGGPSYPDGDTAIANFPNATGIFLEIDNNKDGTNSSVTVNQIIFNIDNFNTAYTILWSSNSGETTSITMAGTNPKVLLNGGAGITGAEMAIIGQDLIFASSGSIEIGESLDSPNLTITSSLEGGSGISISKTGPGGLELGISGSSNINSTFEGTFNLDQAFIQLYGYSFDSTSSFNLSAGTSIQVRQGSSDSITTLNNLTGSGNVELSTGLKLSGTSTYSGIISGGTSSSLKVVEILNGSSITITGVNTTKLLIQVDEGGTLILSNTGSFESSRGLFVNGTLTIEADKSVDALSGSGLVNLQGNTLTITSGVASFSGIISDGSTPGGNVVNTGSNASTLSGNNTFTGTLTVSAGEIILGGTNAYTGTTSIADGATLTLSQLGEISNSSEVITNGTLSLNSVNASIKDLSGSGTVNVNGNTLTISNGGGTFSGVIANGGNQYLSNVIKNGSSTSTFSGDNTFLGSLSVLDGTLSLSGSQIYTGATSVSNGANLTLSNSASIASSSSISIDGTLTYDGISESTINSLSGSGSISAGSTTLTINQSSDATFSGGISGNGSLEKTGSSLLSLTGTNTFSGTTTISEGILSINGSLVGNLDITSTGTLKGTGTIGSGSAEVTNSATLAPGNSIGTLVISGNYTQNSTGELEIEITPSQNDLLQISGSANLSGALIIDPAPGVYAGETVYTILTSSGLTNNLSLQVLGELPGTFSYPSNSIVFTTGEVHHVLPIAKSNLRGNAQNIAEYLFRTGVVPNNADLNSVYQTLLNSDAQNFPTALRKLGPTQFSAFPLVSLQTNSRIAGAFSSNLKNYTFCQKCKELEMCDDDKLEKGTLWLEPNIIVYTQDAYDQNEIEEQIKFQTYTYGSNSGYNHFLTDNLCIGGLLAYTHSNLNWEKNAGNAQWSSVYFGPTLGWYSEKRNFYGDFVLLGVINFYDVERRIVFPGLKRIAKNSHNSYDILFRADGGFKLIYNSIFVQSEASCTSLITITEKYNENGANSLNLLVNRNQEIYIRPQYTLRVGREYYTKKVCLLPSFKIGWVSNIPLTNGIYTAGLINETFPSGNQFPVQGYKRTTNQLLVGAEFCVRKDNFSFEGEFEANYLDRSIIQEGKIRMNWWF